MGKTLQAIVETYSNAEALSAMQTELAHIMAWAGNPGKVSSASDALQTIDRAARIASVIAKELQRRDNIKRGVYS